MNKVKKLFVLVLIAAVVSLGLIGCEDKSEPPAGDQSTKETSTKEAPAEEETAGEHPNGEHPE